MSSVAEIENAEIKQEPIFSDFREKLCFSEDDALDDFTNEPLILNVKTEPEELNESNENKTVEHFVVPVITKVNSYNVVHNNEDVTREECCISKQIKSPGKNQIRQRAGKRKKQIENVPNTCTEDYSVENLSTSIKKCTKSPSKDQIRESAGKRKKLIEKVLNTENCSMTSPTKSKTTFPRVRVPQRGRGVRVRGGRCLGGAAVVKENGTSSPTKRGGSSCRGGRAIQSGGAGNRGGSSRGGWGIKSNGTNHGSCAMRVNRMQFGPQFLDELVINEIGELPEGRGLETALHPKRIRTWQPSNPASLPPSSPSSSVASPSTASWFKRSPAKIVKNGNRKSLKRPPSPSPPGPRQAHNNVTTCRINHGSDEDSNESNGEEDAVIPIIPRAFQSIMETPLDQESADLKSESAVAGDPAPDDAPLTTTEQPWGLYSFDWRPFPNPPIPPESRRETFSEINVGPHTPSVDPYDIFVEIWDRQIMEHIASETNKYAQMLTSQMIENNSLHPTSRISKWYDTTVDELYVYFGIILAMGIVVKSRIEEYWGSTPDIFYTPGFSAHMGIDRFVILNKCLHFNDNENLCALKLDHFEAKLFKIKPILIHLNKKFQELYTPTRNISLDESLLMWKGLLEFSQLIPNKAANRGIKTYEICESQTGYLWRFEVHAHKATPTQQIKDPLEASTPAIVLQLIQGLEHKGYTLWMDNFYQSPCLARRLKCLGFDCVGTLRTDRKFVPPALHSLTKQNMSPGQITGLTSGDVDVMVWRDINRVAMISTYHGNSQNTVRGSSTKPILILDYNIMMGGVDKKDQLLAMYPVERKRSQVWYKKLFRRLLNVSVLNSYVIHRHTSSLTHRNFRINLVKSLLSKHSVGKAISLPTSPTKVDVTHRLAEFPMGQHQRMRRACTACKKQVRTFCVGCDKTVCMDPCFLTIHS